MQTQKEVADGRRLVPFRAEDETDAEIMLKTVFVRRDCRRRHASKVLVPITRPRNSRDNRTSTLTSLFSDISYLSEHFYYQQVFSPARAFCPSPRLIVLPTYLSPELLHSSFVPLHLNDWHKGNEKWKHIFTQVFIVPGVFTWYPEKCIISVFWVWMSWIPDKVCNCIFLQPGLLNWWLIPFLDNKWAPLSQNQQNGMCTQQRLRLDWAVWSASLLSKWRKPGSLATQWVHSEDWSDWVDAQADLSLRWVHSHFVDFVMRWLKYASSCEKAAYHISK